MVDRSSSEKPTRGLLPWIDALHPLRLWARPGPVRWILVGCMSVPMVLALLLALFLVTVVLWDGVQAVGTYSWEEARCEILSSEANGRAFQVEYRYAWNGADYIGDAYAHGYVESADVSEALRLADRHPVGANVPCWVDPEAPDRSYLVRGRSDLSTSVPIGLFAFLFLGSVAATIWLVKGRLARRKGAVESPPAVLPAKSAISSGFNTAWAGVAFFGVVLLFGIAIAMPLLVRPALRALDARSWTALPCEIEESRLGVTKGSSAGSYTYRVEVRYRYEVAGKEYRSERFGLTDGIYTSGREKKAAIVRSLEPGSRVTCYADPRDPYSAVIDRSYSFFGFGLVPAFVVSIGIGGVAFFVWAR